LTVSQQQVLGPLQQDWSNLDPARRQKWLELARRFPSMPPDERQRVQNRMVEWARLTPAERAQARLQFQEVRQLPPDERNAKWQAYQALTDSERRKLAQKALPETKAASVVSDGGQKSPSTGIDAIQPKRSAAMAASPPASAAGVRPTAPIVVQARPGATTTTMTIRKNSAPTPVPGAPKIAATSNYVDPATLLPKRSAQEAQPVGAGEAAPQQ
jgi:hypothetical protein